MITEMMYRIDAFVVVHNFELKFGTL